jgi:hypothetical protein
MTRVARHTFQILSKKSEDKTKELYGSHFELTKSRRWRYLPHQTAQQKMTEFAQILTLHHALYSLGATAPARTTEADKVEEA